MARYFFVVWEARNKKTGKIDPISNTIIKDIHPLVWAASPPKEFRDHFLTYIHFWEEIPEYLVDRLRELHYFSIEEE